MAATIPIPPQAEEPALPAEAQESAGANGSAGEGALVPIGPQRIHERVKLSPPVSRLPVELDVAVPVREFRVRDLINLEIGQVISTQWGHGEDMPLAAGEVQLAWSEFEVVDSSIAVRVTRLA